MATHTLTQSDWNKVLRDIERLKKRIEKLEKTKKPRQSSARKTHRVNTRRKRALNVNERIENSAHQRAIPSDSKVWHALGTVSLGYPTGTDNESIDRDLAAQYGNTPSEN
jgi:hypothetical protein